MIFIFIFLGYHRLSHSETEIYNGWLIYKVWLWYNSCEGVRILEIELGTLDKIGCTLPLSHIPRSYPTSSIFIVICFGFCTTPGSAGNDFHWCSACELLLWPCLNYLPIYVLEATSSSSQGFLLDLYSGITVGRPGVSDLGLGRPHARQVPSANYHSAHSSVLCDWIKWVMPSIKTSSKSLL